MFARKSHAFSKYAYSRKYNYKTNKQREREKCMFKGFAY